MRTTPREVEPGPLTLFQRPRSARYRYQTPATFIKAAVALMRDLSLAPTRDRPLDPTMRPREKEYHRSRQAPRVKSASKFPNNRWPRLPIRTRRLVLRLPGMPDVVPIRRAAAHSSTRWGVHLLPRPYLRRHAVEFVRRKRIQFRKRESLALAITLGNDGSLVGMIELSQLSPTDRRAELGYWIAPGHRGQGYATEAARAICDVGFSTLRLHRIEAGAFVRNHASIRVLEKAGLRHEGRFRERVRFGRSWLDQVWLARLAPT